MKIGIEVLRKNLSRMPEFRENGLTGILYLGAFMGFYPYFPCLFILYICFIYLFLFIYLSIYLFI
jgi:hypothetical protein